MKLQIFKCDGVAYIVGGYGQLDGTVGETVEVALVDPIGDDSLVVSGTRYVFHDAKVNVKVEDFKDGEATEVHLHSGGKIYVIEGLLRRGNELKLAEETVYRYIGRIIVDAYKLRLELSESNKKIKRLEDACSGDDFL